MEQNGQAIMGGFGGSGGVYSAATTGPVARLMAAWWDHFVPKKWMIFKVATIHLSGLVTVSTVVIFFGPLCGWR